MAIKKCNCKSEFQDKRYGAGMRVFTEGTSKKTCTVCGTSATSTTKRK